jgi:hypothetical protein
MPLDETPKPARILDDATPRESGYATGRLLVRASDLRPDDLAAAELMDPP